MKKVFLGGTCNGSKWREKLIEMLKIDYFNPVVKDWTPECITKELLQRELCDYCLYVVTPRMKGVYSIAEVIDDSNKQPLKTIFCILSEDNNDEDYTSISFGFDEIKSLNAVGMMVQRNGGLYFDCLETVAEYLNKN